MSVKSPRLSPSKKPSLPRAALSSRAHTQSVRMATMKTAATEVRHNAVMNHATALWPCM